MITYNYCLPAVAEVLRNNPVDFPGTIETFGGKYASKYVMLMNKYYGFEVEPTKVDKTVVAYTIKKVPDNYQELMDFVKKAAAPKPAPKAKKEKIVVPPAPTVVAETETVVTAVAAAEQKVEPDVTTNFAVDAEWDALDDNFLPDFLKK